MYTHLLVENRKLKFEGCICVLCEMKINQKTHTTIFCFVNTHTTITIVTSTCEHKQSCKLLHQSVNGVTVFLLSQSSVHLARLNGLHALQSSMPSWFACSPFSQHGFVSANSGFAAYKIGNMSRSADHSSSRNAIPRFVGLALSSDKP